MKNICIYHANCSDGFTAAWAVWKKHPQLEFHSASHGQTPPDCTDRDVIIVDFSYKRCVLLEMAKVAKTILILDHHKSAEAELIDLPDNVQAVFDMQRSGAMMAWQWYHPDSTAPLLVAHVQDQDLWKFELPLTKPFMANVSSTDYTFENWQQLAELKSDAEPYAKFIEVGHGIERAHNKLIDGLVKTHVTRSIVAGIDVPTLNAPHFCASNAGHLMGENEPFAAIYWDTGAGRTYSLRSAEDGMDVSRIAARYGGGGHKHAAGFRLTLDSVEQWDKMLRFPGQSHTNNV